MESFIQKRWWLFTFRGILLILFGFIAFFIPGIVLISLIIVFAVLLIASGIFLIYESISSVDKNHRVLKITEGIINFVTAVIILIMPAESIAVIMILVSAWAFVSGIFQIASAIKLRKVINNELLAISGGFVSLIFGIVILFNLIAGAEALVMVFGIFAVITGTLITVLSFKIKKLPVTQNREF
jgi:uncharacterized membrane protein HdeD (DUF308 family)